MKKTLILSTILVAGALVAPAVRADHMEPGDDYAGFYCGLIDQWLRILPLDLGCGHEESVAVVSIEDADRGDRDAADESSLIADRPDSDTGGRCLACGEPPIRREGASVTSDSDRRCLACGGLPTSDREH